MKKMVNHAVFGEVEPVMSLLSPWALGVEQWFRHKRFLEPYDIGVVRMRLDLGISLVTPFGGMFLSDVTP